MALNFGKTRKADKNLYNYAAEDFIPIACHYNEDTLLTKNGQLMQIIHINGINADTVSQQLVNLRQMVRAAIEKNVSSNEYAFWLHTIRRKTNLDDQTLYKKLLPANIHNMWRGKNYWDDKYVNTLYISIIYKEIDLKISTVSSLINSLSTKVVENLHEQYFAYGAKKLNTTVDNILADLVEYGAKKLSIYFEEEQVFSEPMFLFRRIMHLNEMQTPLTDADLSALLATHHYAVGGDKIEVISNDDKKFAAILSIKEYQEVSSGSLDSFLQIPVEMIATEIFYFVKAQDVLPSFAEQDYLLRVSGDTNLRDAKNISEIINQQSTENKFCHQQISIAIIGNDLKKLDAEIYNASSKLAEIGIVHVREDINLEQTFWSQLPSNFSFIRRINPTILKNTAALTSLHNFPTGNQYNAWGKAVTLLRTEKGTPYFMNFHNKNNQGNTCIYGSSKSGKTTLMNFLISEATKYDPSILYLANNDDAEIFIQAIEGTWLNKAKNIINPFMLDDSEDSRQFLNQFLMIICNHYTVALSELELAFIKQMIEQILALPKEKRIFSNIIESLNFDSEEGKSIKPKLQIFAKGGTYAEIFENNSLIYSGKEEIRGFNLNYFSDSYYEKNFYPQEKNLIDQYKVNMKIHSSIRWGVIFALTHFFARSNSDPKILAIDNIGSLCRQDQFQELLNVVFVKIASNNGVVVSNFNLNNFDNIEKQMWSQLFDASDTNIIMPANVILDDLDKILNLTKKEIVKLSSLSSTSRLFLIKQNDQSIAAELSLGGFIGILKILVSKDDEKKIYQKIIEQHSDKVTEWLEPLYEAFGLNMLEE